MSGLEVKRVSPPPVSRSEVMRYLGVKEEYEGFAELYEKALAILSDKVKSSVVFRVMDCRVEDTSVTLGDAVIASRSLARLLSECDTAIIAAATVGRELDILQAKYMRTSAALSVVIGAVGSERIEAIMDSFEAEISLAFGELTVRYSPGYGDLPIEFQRKCFSWLNPERYIGLTLSDSLMMTPSKSVSAIIGIKKVTKP